MRNFNIRTDKSIETTARGYHVLKSPYLNKGVAFTQEERKSLGIQGLLPHAVLSLDEQVKRAYEQLKSQSSDLLKNVYLTALHDRNKVLFYRLLTTHISELLPIVYTPTVGEAIQNYSHEYRRSLGVYLSIENPESIEEAFKNFGARPDEIDLIVATDGERILGIGDWGIGGIDIANGKLVVYTAAAGIAPHRVIPVILDVGTDREELLNDPLYIGFKHKRIRGKSYDQFIDHYVTTALKMFPNAMLHWEDFAQIHARPILEKYKNKICTFNDDIQGTGAISLAAVLSAVRVTGIPLEHHRIVIFGSGSAGIGIADYIRGAMAHKGLSKEEASQQFWCIDKYGLLTETTKDLKDFQKSYAKSDTDVEDWKRNNANQIDFLEVVKNVHPTILIGTSTVAGAFAEEIVKEMAKHVDRPVILPLSNPTSSSEAIPKDLITWTDGKALVATGSPFGSVEYNGHTYHIGQANNAFVFPGIGLGTIVSKGLRVTDKMITCAAEVIAQEVDVNRVGASLLPNIEDLGKISYKVAVSVAKQAIEEGVAKAQFDAIEQHVKAAIWQPVYPTIYPI